jgi:autotransporter-associated beta strand protein
MRGQLFAASVIAGVLGVSSGHAQNAAQNATWRTVPLTGTFNNPLNWSTLAVPTGTATFAASTITGLTVLGANTIGGFTFNPGASAYSFSVPLASSLEFTGAGIVNNSSNSPSFFLAPTSSVVFANSSSAGNATFTTGIAGLLTGNLTFQDNSTADAASINNAGTVSFIGNSSAGAASIVNNGLLTFGGASSAQNATVHTTSGAITQFLANANGGQARFITDSGGVFSIVLAANPVTVGSIEGGGTYLLGANQLTTGTNDLSTTVSGQIFGLLGGSLVKTGSGTLTLSGLNAYTGPTTVSDGSLIVNGSIAASSLTTVNNGATLGGNGVVGTTLINAGGALAPGPSGSGGTLTVAGNLAFQSGAMYVVAVTPSAASATNVSGTATLAGTVQANFGAGTFLKDSYTILTAGIRNGTFDALTTSGLPADFKTSLAYPGNTAVLKITADLVPPVPPSPPSPPTPPTPPLPVNQLNVANAIDNFFNNGGTLPPTFVALFGLSGGNLVNALSQLSGESATGAQRVAFQLTDQFLNLMLDPFVNGRSSISDSGLAIGFAPNEKDNLPPDVALAYASISEAPPKPAFDQRWATWGAAYGGGNFANGDATIGSNNITAQTFGFAAGMDYHVSPNAVVGFALAGGGTNWGLANALGNGRSDAFQVGAYGITWFGPAYLAGALAFTNHWFTTSRSALGDQLSASFDGQSYGARFEAGYRYGVLPTLGVTPYGAMQLQDFHTPSYSEADATVDGFGLSYNAMNATDIRSELGARFDDPTLLYGKPLILFGRVAWAHDWVSNPALGAVFESLPGASFTVNGAPMPPNSALTTAGAQLFFSANWSLLAKFEGEFANGSQTYAGSGTLRYTW